MHKLSNLFSFLSTGLILFILAMVISGWWVSSQVVQAIQGEAEISVYYQEGIGEHGTARLAADIQAIPGVRAVRQVSAAEAYGRMAEILGQDARILSYFDDNPFSPFIEVKISLADVDSILQKIGLIKAVAQIRDNREVLDRLRQLSEILGYLGFLVMAAVGVTTLVIIAHLTRLGILQSSEQINTLRLLGAPEVFIAIPFLLAGVLLTVAGSILAAVLAVQVLKIGFAQIAGPLPFIPLPPLQDLAASLSLLIISIGAVLGVAGSLFGLSAAQNK